LDRLEYAHRLFDGCQQSKVNALRECLKKSKEK
jgi:hypothetical protein